MSSYFPPFRPKFSAYVYGASIKAAYLSGTLVSGGVVTAIAHGLGVKPKLVLVAAMPTRAQAISGAGLDIYQCSASAATSASIFLVGSQKANVAMKYAAFVILN